MQCRGSVSIAGLTAAIVLATLIPGSVTAQTPAKPKAAPASASGKPWTAPKTPWGEPDLQGVWRFEGDTPLERPAALAGRTALTAEEVAKKAQREKEVTTKRLQGLDYDAIGRKGRNGEDPTKAIAGAEYNSFWQDRGRARQISSRTSLIVDPPEGIMPVTEELKQKDIRGAEIVGSTPPADFKNNSYIDRDTGERCLTDGLPGEMWGGTGPNLFIQSPGYVVMVHEQFRDRRIIPTGGRPHANISHWLGDSRGHWEGNTLVVETTHFIDRPDYQWRPPQTWKQPTSKMKLVERWTRTGANTIEYKMTITDPTKFTRPWSVELPLTDLHETFLEYACHEGNYGMIHLLSEERNLEKAAHQKSSTK